jgi:pimeloyl-ACP methyl ester carboxylesterase
MDVYFISGLGADKRAFQHIHLSRQFTVLHIEWIKHYRGESMNAYARRLAASIDTSRPFALVGLSFGGMIATEMATFLHPAKVILISSTYTVKELQLPVRWIGRLRLHKLVAPSWLKKATRLAHWFFGTKTTLEKKLLNQIMQDTDEGFLGWAIDVILTWKNKKQAANCVRIHGDKDRILPYYAGADVVIRGGGHFMVFNKAKEIAPIIETSLSS